MRLSVCIEMIFTELPFLDRIAAVAEAGYGAVEFWRWRDKDLEATGRAARQAGVDIAGMVLEMRASLVDPDARDGIVVDAGESIKAARALGCGTLIATTGNERPGVARAEQHAAIVANLRAVAPLAEAAGVIVVLEPLNTLVDHAGYYLTGADEGAEIVREVGSPAVRLLFDIYHQQVTEGNLWARLEMHRELIGHIHVAGVPGRHDPGHGEINYPFLMDGLRAWPYTGSIGLEYRPLGPSRESLLRAAQLLGGSLDPGR